MDIEEIRKSAGVAPILYVSDIEASFDYYVNKLQFTKAWDWGDPPNFGCVYFGNVELFFCQGGQGNPGTWMSIFIDNIDDYTALIKQAGAEIIYGPADEPWGMREIHVKDPDGHILRIGTGQDEAVDPVNNAD